jgi:hypothetical protein
MWALQMAVAQSLVTTDPKRRRRAITASHRELRPSGNDDEASEELPMYLFARHRPHLLKVVWLPIGWAGHVGSPAPRRGRETRLRRANARR